MSLNSKMSAKVQKRVPVSSAPKDSPNRLKGKLVLSFLVNNIAGNENSKEWISLNEYHPNWCEVFFGRWNASSCWLGNEFSHINCIDSLKTEIWCVRVVLKWICPPARSKKEGRKSEHGARPCNLLQSLTFSGLKVHSFGFFLAVQDGMLAPTSTGQTPSEQGLPFLV